MYGSASPKRRWTVCQWPNVSIPVAVAEVAIQMMMMPFNTHESISVDSHNMHTHTAVSHVYIYPDYPYTLFPSTTASSSRKADRLPRRFWFRWDYDTLSGGVRELANRNDPTICSRLAGTLEVSVSMTLGLSSLLDRTSTVSNSG